MGTVFDKTTGCKAARCIIAALLASVFVGVPAASAETAQNAFVSVTASGVRRENGRDFSATGDVAYVVANPGWRLRTAPEVRLDVGAPAVYRVGDLLGENDADGHIDVIRTETEDVHVAPPVISAKVSCGGPFIIAYPASNKTVSVSFSASIDKAGLHSVTTRTYKNGELEKTEGPEDVAMSSDVWKWEWSAGPYSGSSDKQSFSTNLVFTPGTYEISGTVKAKCSSCGKCMAVSSAETNLLVSLLKVECNPWIGQDRTGDPALPYESQKIVAAASLAPSVPGVQGVEWEYEGDRTCDEFHPDAWAATLWSTSRDAHSKTFLSDSLKATVLGVSATTNFTVVAVDVTIDDVDEDKEESEGKWLYFVPDNSCGEWTEEGTNTLSNVSIVCNPSDGEMCHETITMKFPDHLLYVQGKDGEYAEAKGSYLVEELLKTSFKLHGHRKSTQYLGDEIMATHESSGAIDKSNFTVFGRPWLVPDYDRNGIIDSDNDEAKAKSSKTVFRFWVNDDDDYILRLSNLYDFQLPFSWTNPGGINEHNRNIQQSGYNCSDNKVNGLNDLVDFTPVLAKLDEVRVSGTPSEIIDRLKWELRSDCVRVVWTGLGRENAGMFHSKKCEVCGPGLNQKSYKAESVLIEEWRKFPEVFALRASSEEGVVLIEGSKAKQAGRFEIRGILPDGTILTKGSVKIAISEVEDMFRWINIRGAAGKEKGKPSAMEDPPNRPGSECDGKHYVFVHGYNVNADSAVGWASEVFKRLWQSGLESGFVGVDWTGDYSQLNFPLPYYGTVSPNYYDNVRRAFNSAGSLKGELDKIQGEKIVMAHSLGNVLVSSAICDKGLKCKYIMLNAAVPSEAYNSEMFNWEMVRGEWRSLPMRTWAANWYKLPIFAKNDFRNKLNWESRFENIPGAVSYYSPTEDVLANPSMNWFGAAWSQQELFKGSPVKGTMSGRYDAGWARSRHYWKKKGSGRRTRWESDVDRINSLSCSKLVQWPVFSEFTKERERLHSLEPMVNTEGEENLRAYFLGHSIPAKSFAVGGNLIKADNVESRNYVYYKNPLAWPRKNGKWLHSDIKNIAYWYIDKFYKELVKEGGGP